MSIFSVLILILLHPTCFMLMMNKAFLSLPSRLLSIIKRRYIPSRLLSPAQSALGGPPTVDSWGVRRNGETIGTAYDPVGATAVLPGDVSAQRFPVGACDCANSDSCGGERS